MSISSHGGGGSKRGDSSCGGFLLLFLFLPVLAEDPSPSSPLPSFPPFDPASSFSFPFPSSTPVVAAVTIPSSPPPPLSPPSPSFLFPFPSLPPRSTLPSPSSSLFFWLSGSLSASPASPSSSSFSPLPEASSLQRWGGMRGEGTGRSIIFAGIRSSRGGGRGGCSFSRAGGLG